MSGSASLGRSPQPRWILLGFTYGANTFDLQFGFDLSGRTARRLQISPGRYLKVDGERL